MKYKKYVMPIVTFLVGLILGTVTVSNASPYMVNDYLSCKTFDKVDDKTNCLWSYLKTIDTDRWNCGDYTDFYKQAGEEIGLKATKINLNRPNGFLHTITILSSDSGYCVADNNNKPYCIYLDDEPPEDWYKNEI